MRAHQGWINGLHHAPNGHGPAPSAATRAALHASASSFMSVGVFVRAVDDAEEVERIKVISRNFH